MLEIIKTFKTVFDLTSDSLTDWLQVALTFFGGLYAIYLLRQSNRERRNQYVGEMMNRFYDDVEIRTVIYAVDSGRDVHEIRFKGRLEQQADKTIRYLDYVGYLLKENKLKKQDLRPFKYEITRLINHRVMNGYIQWLKSIDVNLDNLEHLRMAIDKMILENRSKDKDR